MCTMSKLGDFAHPIEHLVLTQMPNNPIVHAILYLFNMFPPFQRIFNKAIRERDLTKIETVGPIACALNEILRNIESIKEDKKFQDFTVYRGVAMSHEEINNYKYIIHELELNMKRHSQKPNVVAGKIPFDFGPFTFHLDGITTATMNRAVAEQFSNQHCMSKGKVPVLICITIKIDNEKYIGFHLNKPEYTPYPNDQEYIFPDGVDTIVRSVKEIVNEKDNTKKQIVIELEQINDASTQTMQTHAEERKDDGRDHKKAFKKRK